MEENNKQDLKFKDLSTKKKVIHYIGWPLLALGCVGTIVFGSLWCKNKNNSNNCQEINFTTDEWHSEDTGSGSANEITHKIENGTTSTDRIKVNIDFSILPTMAKKSNYDLAYLFFIVSDQNPYEHCEDAVPVPTHKILTIDYNVNFFEDGEKVRPATFGIMPWCDSANCMPYNEGGQICYVPGYSGDPCEENTFPHDLDIFNSVLSFEFSLFDNYNSDFYVSTTLVLAQE